MNSDGLLREHLQVREGSGDIKLEDVRALRFQALQRVGGSSARGCDDLFSAFERGDGEVTPEAGAWCA
jgi:hypothetical protein